MRGASSGIRVLSTQSLDVGPEDTSCIPDVTHPHPGHREHSAQPREGQDSRGARQVAPRDAGAEPGLRREL